MPEQHLEKRGRSMAYKLNITEHADELLDNLVYHLIYRLKNKQAMIFNRFVSITIPKNPLSNSSLLLTRKFITVWKSCLVY